MTRYVRQRLPSFFILAVVTVAAVAGLLASGPDAASLRTIALDQAPAAAADTSAEDFVWSRGFSPAAAGATGDRLGAPPAAPEVTFIWPASGAISQGMTARHPRGLDIAAELGDPVLAVREGEVIAAGGDACCVYGLHVIVQHDDGWSSLYAHLDSLSVELGDRVEQGDVLGPAGNTGKADGVHLHFELLSFGAPVDPLGQLQPRRSYTPVIEPIETPEGVDEPEPTIEEPALVGASAGEAIDAAGRWMARQGEAGYQVDYDSCFAISFGPNWSVSCAVTPWGCEGTACRSFLEACVIGSLRLVEATCSGY